MLNHLDPASALAIALLVFALIMVVMFEATNGFHDAANAVATVIYTKSLSPAQAIVLSGCLNFTGVMVGGIAVAYMVTQGAGLQYQILGRILVAWVLTLPVTVVIAGSLYYFLTSPRF